MRTNPPLCGVSATAVSRVPGRRTADCGAVGEGCGRMGVWTRTKSRSGFGSCWEPRAAGQDEPEEGDRGDTSQECHGHLAVKSLPRSAGMVPRFWIGVNARVLRSRPHAPPCPPTPALTRHTHRAGRSVPPPQESPRSASCAVHPSARVAARRIAAGDGADAGLSGSGGAADDRRAVEAGDDQEGVAVTHPCATILRMAARGPGTRLDDPARMAANGF